MKLTFTPRTPHIRCTVESVTESSSIFLPGSDAEIFTGVSEVFLEAPCSVHTKRHPVATGMYFLQVPLTEHATFHKPTVFKLTAFETANLVVISMKGVKLLEPSSSQPRPRSFTSTRHRNSFARASKLLWKINTTYNRSVTYFTYIIYLNSCLTYKLNKILHYLSSLIYLYYYQSSWVPFPSSLRCC
jgi:hypothetical protein